jgi:hypothetical protein
MPNITDIAEMVESRLNDHIGYEMERPYVVGVTDTADGVELTPMESVTSRDIYRVLDSDEVADFVRGRRYFAVVTTGWASPLAEGEDEPEVAPSVHPERRRVRLTIVASPAEVASVIRFADAPDDTITDEGNARGSLADAVRSVVAKMN